MIKKSIMSLFVASIAFTNLNANEAPALPVQVFKAEKKEPDQQAHEAAHHEAYEQQREKVRFPQF